MTREEYEFDSCVTTAAKHFHEQSGNYPTKEFVVRMLQEKRNAFRFSPDCHWRATRIQKQTYIWFAYSETIRRIVESSETDPIRIIYRFYYYMDDMIGKHANDNLMVWEFMGTMQDTVRKILDLCRGLKGENKWGN